jgi:hypothetical protein
LNYESQEGEKEERKIGVGSSRIKAVIKELRKQYGPMLKRLAE